MPAHVKDRAPAQAPQASRKAKVSKPRPALPREPANAVPAVLSQTSRMHKVMAAVQGDDEFSVFSTSPVARQKDPVDVNPNARAKEKAEGGGKLLRFFRGLIGG